MATGLAKSAVIIGIAVAAIAAVASAAAWWRWERIESFISEIPLPPGSVIVRSAEPGEGRKYHSAVVRSSLASDVILEFYRREMALRGWQPEEESGSKARYRKGEGLLRLVLHPNPNGTVFTLNVRL
ncbi:MAG TPA: hypothetical protein VMX35_12170 [Acidobacteriota bacterium]|nr:hypothetical protein [Acidobacteriota bacterium]